MGSRASVERTADAVVGSLRALASSDAAQLPLVLNSPLWRMSYPNSVPGLYPDAELLARVTKRAGWELRLIVLMRDPADCLVSIVRRGLSVGSRWAAGEAAATRSLAERAKQPPELPVGLLCAGLERYSPSTEHAMETISRQLSRLTARSHAHVKVHIASHDAVVAGRTGAASADVQKLALFLGLGNASVLVDAITDVQHKHPQRPGGAWARATHGAQLASSFRGVYALSAKLWPFDRLESEGTRAFARLARAPQSQTDQRPRLQRPRKKRSR